MTPMPEVKERLRRYLLGQVAEETREQIERDLLTSEELFEELLVIEDEIIDAYLRGELNDSERSGFEQHFLATRERQEKLKFGGVFSSYIASQQVKESLPRRIEAGSGPPVWMRSLFSSPLRMAAFALVILAVGLGVWRVFFHKSDVEKGLLALNAAYRQERPVEARISSLDYAPYVPTRGPGDHLVDQNQLRRAELFLAEARDQSPSPAVHHALGNVYLSKKQWDEAINEFNEALRGDPRNARLLNDLGAAWLEKGKSDRFKARSNPSSVEAGKAAQDFVNSLEKLIEARKADPNLASAYFNSALVHQELNLLQEAEADWKEYLAKDSASQWADEARRHLAELEELQKARSRNKSALLPEFLAAYDSRNDTAAIELLSTNTEAIAGQLMWWELAVAFLDASARLSGESDRYYQALAYAASLQLKKSGDRFVVDLAAFYYSTSPLQRSELLTAHSLIREAHALLTKSQVAEAVDLYTKARNIFDKAGDQAESLFAGYWIAYSYYRQSKREESQDMLTDLVRSCRAKNYLSLLEKALTMIANIQAEASEYSKSIASYVQSLEISKRTGDVYNLQKNLSSLANNYKNLGVRRESLGNIELCLESAKIYWPGARQMYRNYYTTAAVLNSFGHHVVAAEYEKAALKLAIEESDPVLENQSYVALAAISSKSQDYTEAIKYANLGYQAAGRMNERTRLRPAADAFLLLGHIERQIGDFDKALAYYDEAIKSYESIQHFALLYEAHKGKLLDYIAQQKDPEAKAELQIVLTLFEEHRSRIREERSRNSFFDLQQNVYDVAIDFEFSRMHDQRQAFEYSEKSRSRSLLDLMNRGAETRPGNEPDLIISSVRQPLDLDGIRERMPEQAQVVQYAVLDDKLIVWVISKTKVEAIEQPIDAANLSEKVRRYCEAMASLQQSNNEDARRAGQELYALLIKPIERLLEKDKEICVVPDKILNSLPFNTLISSASGRYLIDDYLVTFAPSSNVFVICSEVARRRGARADERLLSVGSPNFSTEEFPDLPELPASEAEARQIAGYYKSATVLVRDQATKSRVRAQMASAEVIHVASHYVVNGENPLLSKLLLTREPTGRESNEESNGALEAYEICESRLPSTRLVTLSACQTGVERYYNGEGMIGMSRTFLIAGVPTVVASLWSVASDPTADLMVSLHRYRTRGGYSTARALRQAQLDMIASGHREPFYWAPFIFIGGYASF